MDSSVRIDYNRSSKNVSQIKVTFRETSNPNDDGDPRDKMVRDFLYPEGVDSGLGKHYILTDYTLLLDGISAIIEPIKSTENIPQSLIPPKRTIRDFFELDLPHQEARMAAFDNTSKTRLDLEVSSLSEAILQSFYISDTKQGAEYWQDIMVNSIK